MNGRNRSHRLSRAAHVCRQISFLRALPIQLAAESFFSGRRRRTLVALSGIGGAAVTKGTDRRARIADRRRPGESQRGPAAGRAARPRPRLDRPYGDFMTVSRPASIVEVSHWDPDGGSNDLFSCQLEVRSTLPELKEMVHYQLIILLMD